MIGRASGWKVWTITRPGASRPLRPASWVISWKVRSSARKSGSAERGVGVDHGGELDTAEVVSLGDHLRPEQHGAARRGEARERRRGQLGVAGAVAVEPDQLELGEGAPELAFELLGAGAEAGELGRAAARAGCRRGGTEAAVVADEAARPRAARARRRSARSGSCAPQARQWSAGARPRRLRSRIAFPPRSATRAQLVEQRRRKRVAGLAAEVDDAHGRELAADASAELEPLEGRPALRTRRRRAEDGDGSLERGTLDRDGARVVARVGVLLVGGVVLLVDDDQPRAERPVRRPPSERRRRPRLAASDALALVTSLRLAEPRVEDRDPLAEAGAHPAERLRRKRDLRHEHDRREAALEPGGRNAGGRPRSCPTRSGRRGGTHLLCPPSMAADDAVARRAAARCAAPPALPRRRASGARPAALRSPRRRGKRGRDERERARRRRTVVVGEPEREVDERRAGPDRGPARSATASTPAGGAASSAATTPRARRPPERHRHDRAFSDPLVRPRR